MWKQCGQLQSITKTFDNKYVQKCEICKTKTQNNAIKNAY